MKIMLLTAIWVLMFGVCILAQTDETPPCPTIVVMGPSTGRVQSGMELIFTANVAVDNWKNLTYKWKLTNDIAIRGQGTPVIHFTVTHEMDELDLEVSVEITELPKNCANVVSEKIKIEFIVGTLIPLLEYERISLQEEKARLTELADEFQKGKKFIAYFIFKYTKTDDLDDLKTRLSNLSDYLINSLGIPANKFVFRFSETSVYETKIWDIPLKK